MVVGAHERDHLAVELLLDDALEARSHEILQFGSLLDHGAFPTLLQQGLLGAGEAAAKEHDHEIAPVVRAGLGGTLAVVLLQQVDDAPRDCGHGCAVLRSACAVSGGGLLRCSPPLHRLLRTHLWLGPPLLARLPGAGCSKRRRRVASLFAAASIAAKRALAGCICPVATATS